MRMAVNHWSVPMSPSRHHRESVLTVSSYKLFRQSMGTSAVRRWSWREGKGTEINRMAVSKGQVRPSARLFLHTRELNTDIGPTQESCKICLTMFSFRREPGGPRMLN